MNSSLEWAPVVLGLLASGAFAGVLAGLLGVGGGIITVPVLFLLFQFLGVSPASAMLVATGTSLMTIVPTSLVSARAHHKRGNVDLAVFRRWLLPMVLGVVIGSQIATRVNGLLVSGLFGVVALLVAANTLLRSGAPPLRGDFPGAPLQAVLAMTIGGLSVMMGIGGGTLGVATMTAFNMPAHRAVGTAALFGLVIALPGACLMLLAAAPGDALPGTVGLVSVPGFLLLAPVTSLFAPLGVRLGARLDGMLLKKVFALFLTLVALRMLWQSAAALF